MKLWVGFRGLGITWHMHIKGPFFLFDLKQEMKSQDLTRWKEPFQNQQQRIRSL